jgi:hypothetical protein
MQFALQRSDARHAMAGSSPPDFVLQPSVDGVIVLHDFAE